jgi:RNA recognition motif-containing protein
VFGRFGGILKIVVNKARLHHEGSMHGPTCSAYITFDSFRSARRCIRIMDHVQLSGRHIRFVIVLFCFVKPVADWLGVCV